MNSSRDDFGLVLGPGTGNGFLSSDRPGGKGKDDIYFIRNFSFSPETKNPEFSLKTESGQVPLPESKPEPIPESAALPSAVQVLPEPEPVSAEPQIREEEMIPEEPASFFTVQVRAAYNPLDLSKISRFEGEESFFRQIGDFYKYFIGKFDTFNEARGEYLRLRKKFPDCFIAAFMDDQPIPVDVLRKILEQE